MPLDEIGQRYADSFYQRRVHEISPTQPQRIGALQNQHAARGSIRSSGYIREHYKLVLGDIDSLAQAKLEGLVRAYEKSGLPFDEAAFHDVKTQIVDFCQSEQHKLIGSMNKTAGNFLGGNAFEPFAKEIVAEIDAMIARLVCDLEMKRDETLLEDRRTKKAYAAGLGKRWDVFISHASEDKEEFVRPLAKALEQSGLEVWFDETTLKVGDRLRESIDYGLSRSRFGVVVLSKHFFSKNWPKEELEGLSTKEISGVKVILPVWHNITQAEVAERSPTLAGRLGAHSKAGLEKVVRQLREAMGQKVEEVKTDSARESSQGKAQGRVHFVPDAHNNGWAIQSEDQMEVRLGGVFTYDGPATLTVLQAFAEETRLTTDMMVQVITPGGSGQAVSVPYLSLDSRTPVRAFINLRLTPLRGTRGETLNTRILFRDAYNEDYPFEVNLPYIGKR